MFDGKFEQINLDVSRFFSFGGSGWLTVGLVTVALFDVRKYRLDVGLVE